MAASGTMDADRQLPYLDRIRSSFGRHDVSGVRAQIGGPATEATAALGASAYAHGDQVAFADSPDLHTAAHEAAHVVQQRSGVQLPGGVGEAGDAYERHADAVADQVVAGGSAEALLDAAPGGGGGIGVQRKELPGALPSLALGDALGAKPAAEETAISFFDGHASLIRDSVVSLMSTNNLQISSPYLCWAVGTFGADVAKATFGMATTYAALKRTLIGDDFDAAMERGYADENAIPSMALELKGLLLSRIAASLKRISPRYVLARHQALLRAEEAAKKPIAADAGPQPAATEVLTSHPMDRHVLDRFLAGAVKWNDVERFRKEHPEENKQHKLATLRSPITLSVQNSRWVRVNEPLDASAEEVSKELFGTTEGATYLTRAEPLFGIDPKAWQAYPLSKYVPKSQSAAEIALDAPAGPLTSPNKDPAAANAPAGLAGVPGVDQIAGKQSETLVAEGVGAKGVAARLAMLRLTIGDIAKSTTKLGLEHTVAAVLGRIEQREKELASGVPYSNEVITGWDANSKAQLAIVNSANTGVTQAVQAVASVAAPPPALKGGGAAQITFDKLVAPARTLARSYLDAIAVSDLPETAATKLAAADDTAAVFPIEMANALLEQVRRMLEDAARMAATTKGTVSKGGDGIYAGGDLEKLVRADLVELRATVISDPKGAQTKLMELQGKIQDLLLLAQTAVSVWSLESLIQQLVDHKTATGSITGKNADYDAAIKKLDQFSLQFHTDVFIPYTTGDVLQKKAAAKKFETLKSSPVLVDLQREMPEFIKKQEEYEHWASFFMMLGVGFASAGLGEAVGAASGFAKGSWQLILTEAGVEAAASTAYSTAMQKDPTVGTMVLGFMQSFGNTAFMKATMPAAKAALEKQIGKGATEVATLATLFATNATQKIAIAIAMNPKLTDEELAEILRDTAAETLGGAMFNHFSEKFLAHLGPKVAANASLKGKYAEIEAHRQALAAESKALETKGAAGKKVTKADSDKLIQKAKAELADELHFVNGALTNAANDPSSGISGEMLTTVSESLQRTQYLLKKQSVIDRLKHVTGDTYLADPHEFQQLSQEIRDLGYTAVGEEVFEPVANHKGRSLRFEPKKGAGAPLEEAPRPLRICENGDPVKTTSKITPEAFADVVKTIRAGRVPRVVDLPDTVSNLKGHLTCEKIARDPLLNEGSLVDLRTQFQVELALRLSTSPPETDLNGKIWEVLGTPEGVAKYHRKGPPLTDTKQIKELGGIYKLISLRALVGNKMLTQKFYKTVLDAAGPNAGFPTSVDAIQWKLEHPQKIADFMAAKRIFPGPQDLNLGATVEGKGAGSSSWWMSGADAMTGGVGKTTLKQLHDSAAIYGDYMQGSLLVELPADVATGQKKVSTGIGEETAVARRPTVFDGFGQDLYVSSTDPTAPTGSTAPDPASGRKPVREVIVGPIPLGATTILQFLEP